MVVCLDERVGECLGEERRGWGGRGEDGAEEEMGKETGRVRSPPACPLAVCEDPTNEPLREISHPRFGVE